MHLIDDNISKVESAQIPSGASTEPFFRLFREYADKDAILAEINRAFFDGIELFAGADCRKRCQTEGLAQLHQHYPAEHIGLLEAFVSHRMRRSILHWTAKIGRNDVGFNQDFLVQDLLVVRVHYPHSHIGRKPSVAFTPSLYRRIRFGFSSTLERFKEAYDSKSAIRLPFQVWEYSRQRRKRAALPLPYRCHAPHLDSWLGQPIGGLSVWLAIAGVDKDNSMCLYPETFGVRLPHSTSQFLGSGYRLPKPTRPDIQDGDLFVFTTDMLHSSQLNVSDKTRIAFTTRIEKGRPQFSDDTLWFVERWYSADGILAGRWKRKNIRGAENRVPRKGKTPPISNPTVNIPEIFRVDRLYTIGPSDMLSENDKIAVQFSNKRLLILRMNGQLTAFSANCPHGDYNMADGYHDDCVLTCPGHGLEFDISTGESRLKRYRLARFKVSEREGKIVVGPL